MYAQQAEREESDANEGGCELHMAIAAPSWADDVKRGASAKTLNPKLHGHWEGVDSSSYDSRGLLAMTMTITTYCH